MKKLSLLLAALTVLALAPAFAEKVVLTQMVSQGRTTEADIDAPRTAST